MGVARAIGDSGMRLFQAEHRTFLMFYLASIDPHCTDTLEDGGVIGRHRCKGPYSVTRTMTGCRSSPTPTPERSTSADGLQSYGAQLPPTATPVQNVGATSVTRLFHDTTLECVAESYTLTTATQSMEVTPHALVDRLRAA